ncbi:MAG: HlyD family efflux transporter periplasmic adaptor subunit [Oscillochloris sp.]|nr:HlyD family efflux transporter periplasmic adaptor subunit [Oscillochloris sp.]
MSVSSPPAEQRVIGRLGGRKARRRFSPWVVLPLALILAAAGFLAWRTFGSRSAAATTVSTATVATSDLSVSVSGSGTVQPVQTRALSFSVSGTLTDVLVNVGDTVTEGQALATVDPQDLQMALLQAEANLKSAEASLASAKGEGATEADIASAKAKLTSAQASYEKTRTGSVTAAELESAKAQLASAQAKLDDLLDGPTAAELTSAQNTVQQAQLSLQSQRTSLAAAKEKAAGTVTTAANNLRDAQDSYSTVYWSNRQLENSPSGLSQSAKDEEASALRAVTNAEESLRQAQLAYEQAKQAESIGIQEAEASLKEAQQQLAELQEGATATDIASARASLASAKANLATLQSPASAEDLAIARASLEQAQISLDSLTTPGSASTIASAEASVAQAQVEYEQAKLDLEHGTLTAPFAGVVASVDATVGDDASSASITVIDLTSFYVDLSLSESDIGSVVVGQPVTLTFDALSDVTIEGVVQTVAPVATVSSNVATYTVRVSFASGDAAMKAGMTATGAIQTAQHEGALVVPTRAIQTVNGTKAIQVQQAGQPPVTVQVETGLVSNGMTEIVSCVDTGNQCVKSGDTVLIVTSTSTGTSSTTTTQNSLLSGGGMGGPPSGGGMGGPPPGQ